LLGFRQAVRLAWLTIPNLPKYSREQCTHSVGEYIEMIREGQISEEIDARKVLFKKPGPDKQWDQKLGSGGRSIIVPQTNPSHDKQHDGHPKWNADDVIQIRLGENIWEMGFENPAVGEIQDKTKQKKRIFEIAIMHDSMLDCWDMHAGNDDGN
jgi:hypothetical protein